MPTQESLNHPRLAERDAGHYAITTWTARDVPAIARLEETWAPWLQKPPERFATIASHFPEIQLVAKNENGGVAGSLTTNRIHWDGDPKKLSTWDTVAGGSVSESDYTTTYKTDGNTLFLIAATVDPEVQSKGLAPKLVKEMKKKLSLKAWKI